MVIDIVIVVETFIFFSSSSTRYSFYITFFGASHTRTHLYAQKRVFNNELASRQTTFEEYNFEKKSSIWISSQIESSSSSAASSLLVYGISIFIVPNQRFWLLRCQRHGSSGSSGNNSSFDFVSHHLSPYSVFTCMNLINMGHMHVRACVRACAHSPVIHCCFLFLTHCIQTHNFLCFISIY